MNFIRWVKLILNNQESCVMNNGTSTGYFTLSSGTRQGDPISAYLFILVMEILFIQIRSDKNIQGLKIFGYEFKLSAFADDVSCFLYNLHSVEQLLKLLQISQEFTSFKVNYDKSEICGIGSMKWAIRVFSQLRPIDLLNDSVKILGCHHSYNTHLAFERNFSDTISNISNVLNLWSLRGLSLLGRVLIFKTLGFSKIQYLAAMSEVPTKVIDELKAIQNRFIWKHSTTKIKHSTLIADYENGGISNVDIPTKLKALKLTWVRRPRDDNHHPWKIIPCRHLSLPNGESIFVRNFKCNSDLIKKLDSLPSFYKELASYWSEASYSAMNHVEILLTESLWYNTNVKINNSTVLYKEFALAGVNQVCHLFDKFGKLIKFNDLVDKTGLSPSLFFTWMQLIDALPVNWKQAIKSNSNSMQSDSVSFSKYSLYSEKDSRIFTISLSYVGLCMTNCYIQLK